MSIELVLQIVTAVIVGLGAGYIGSLMVLRRMSLVGDALSHVALPGLAIALLLGANPLWGALGALSLAVVGIWYLQERTVLPTETIVGIFFTAALAVGLLLTPEHELLEALFGDITSVTVGGIAISFVSVILVSAIVSRITRPLILDTISRDLAQANGVDTRTVNLLFLFTVAIVVGLGIKVTGTILTGALVVIPAATARNLTSSLTRYTLIAALIGATSAVVGVVASASTGYPAGPLVILAGGIAFLVSLLFRRP